ncbi:YhbD family protein [Paenibacillus marinisediminis]
MEEPLISKKELLELTGISYGQLYRWKRKDIIPDDWFIRKSTFTGQETYFPKRKILERIDKIVSMKDSLSLDELAAVFSLSPINTAQHKSDLIQREIISPRALDLYISQMGDAEAFTFEKVIYMYLLDQVLAMDAVDLTEGRDLLLFLNEKYTHFQGKACDLLIIRKLNVTTFMLISSPHELYVDSAAQVIAQLSVSGCLEQLKAKLT